MATAATTTNAKMATTADNNNNNRNDINEIIQLIPKYPSLIVQEESIGKNPYDVSSWVMYLDEVDTIISNNKNNKNINDEGTTKNNLILLRDLIGRRSVSNLPKSYKLWKLHWEFVLQQHSTAAGSSSSSSIINININKHSNIVDMFERSLVTLHKFPKVWVEYLHYMHSRVITETTTTSTSNTTSTDNNTDDDDVEVLPHPTQLRRLANRALEALPVTQHDKIWPVLLKYYQTTEVENSCIPKETKLCLLRRYIQYDPSATHDVANFLVDQLGQWNEAALLYVKLLNDPHYSKLPTTRKELWMSLAKICCSKPVEDTLGLNWDGMVRAAVANKNFLPSELQGVLWNQLADSWIRRGQFQLARSVYEEAIESVTTVRDFTILLDAYLQFEEGLLEATMEEAQQQDSQQFEDDVDDDDEGKGETNANQGDEDSDDWDILVPQSKLPSQDDQQKRKKGQQQQQPKTTMADLELALARAEDLTARRPILLNRVLLRQNPHDVGEWLKRARLYKEQEQISQAAAALEEALKTVHARRAFGGSPSTIVLELVKIYETDMKDVSKARDLLDRICNQWEYEFKMTDDLAECHAAWTELELRLEAWDDALDVIRRSVVPVPNAPKFTKGLSKSLRLWDLVLDLEESLGTIQTTKDAYNRAIELRVATPLHILNFASYLTEQKYFEEAFSAYERGIELFEFPGVKVIWKSFLDAFLKRYKGTKIERTRDLFHRCLEACPAEFCVEFYLMNGKFEEEYGLTKRALGVYREMCQKVLPADKYTAYQLFITKTTKYLGKTATRDIYQSAIEDLEDENSASKLCIDFANMETSLHEIDRARAVLTYGAQMADPRRNEEYWKVWNEFEVSHGNEETFREMLRIKRSVEASFSTVNYNAAEMSTTNAKDTLSNEEAIRMIAEREGVELDPHATKTQKPIQGFVPASSSSKRPAEAANLDDIEERAAKLRKATAASASADAEQEPPTNDDDDEIDIDDLDDDEEEEDGDDDSNNKPPPKPAVKNVSTKSVPAAVLGGLAKLVDQEEKEEETPKGALERLRAAQSKD